MKYETDWSMFNERSELSSWSALEDPFYPPRWCVVGYHAFGWEIVKSHLTEAEARGWADELNYQKENNL